MKKLKQRLKSKETLFGCWLNAGSSVTAEIVGNAGYDWVLIDLEHGAGTENDILHQLQALEHTQAGTVIRVESHQRQRLHRMLDLGAEGIMCPRIETVEEANLAARAMRYQPEGLRGAAFMVRATQFGKNFEEYYANASENLLGVIQIETIPILDHLDEVASIDGVDVLFVGPLDLSIALGIRGQTDHPKFVEIAKSVSSAANNHGKSAGILLKSPHEFPTFQEMGYQFIACGADSAFVKNGAEQTVNKLKNML